jgi:hypothetical protein
VPTPFSFDFTQCGVSGLNNENTRVQSVTNFLKIKNGRGPSDGLRASEPGPYDSRKDLACGAT